MDWEDCSYNTFASLDDIRKSYNGNIKPCIIYNNGVNIGYCSCDKSNKVLGLFTMSILNISDVIMDEIGDEVFITQTNTRGILMIRTPNPSVHLYWLCKMSSSVVKLMGEYIQS